MNGAIMDPAEIEAHGGQLSEESVEFFSEHSAGAGSGPYILDHWTREVEAVLVRNPNFWGRPDNKQPWFDKIHFFVVKEAVDQKMMLEVGDLDIIYSTTPTMWKDMENDPNLHLVPLDPARYYYMGMNCKQVDSPFRDLKVRQAVKCAIDREDYLELNEGYGRLQGSSIVYGYPGHDPTLLDGPYSSNGNVEKAKQLLAESSYPNGFDTELLVSEGTMRETMAPLIQQQLAEIGINIEIRVYAGATALKMFRRAEYNGLACFSWGIDYPDPQNLADIHWMDPTLPPHPGAVNARVGYDNTIHASILETHLLCEQAMETVDPAERAALYKEAGWIDHEYGPWVYFYGVMYMRPRRNVVHGGFPVNPMYGWEILELWKEIEW
jgi:peptide/nickel transport system substrate-binding protein